MTRQELTRAILDALTAIAPEVDPAAIEPTKPLREQIDLDSADWLNFLVALHEKTGIDIPDADVGGLTTLEKLVDYCAARQ